MVAVDMRAARPASCISSVGQDDGRCRQIGQGIRHDVCMDIDYGQPESPQDWGVLLKKYRDKTENIIFIEFYLR